MLWQPARPLMCSTRGGLSGLAKINVCARCTGCISLGASHGWAQIGCWLSPLACLPAGGVNSGGAAEQNGHLAADSVEALVAEDFNLGSFRLRQTYAALTAALEAIQVQSGRALGGAALMKSVHLYDHSSLSQHRGPDRCAARRRPRLPDNYGLHKKWSQRTASCPV